MVADEGESCCHSADPSWCVLRLMLSVVSCRPCLAQAALAERRGRRRGMADQRQPTTSGDKVAGYRKLPYRTKLLRSAGRLERQYSRGGVGGDFLGVGAAVGGREGER